VRWCVCDEAAARRYRARLSGPLRDRIDMWISMPAASRRRRDVPVDGVEPSATVARRINVAWRRALDRQGAANGELPMAAPGRVPGFAPDTAGHLEQRASRFSLSPRRLHRVARLARTIADLEGSDAVLQMHVDEALLYRPEAAQL
jgi:magnesium chelatase family protein